MDYQRDNGKPIFTLTEQSSGIVSGTQLGGPGLPARPLQRSGWNRLALPYARQHPLHEVDPLTQITHLVA